MTAREPVPLVAKTEMCAVGQGVGRVENNVLAFRQAPENLGGDCRTPGGT